MGRRSRSEVVIAPSLLSADFSNLKRSIEAVEKGGARWLHVDVMDGHFVPNITIGPLIVEAIRPITKLTIDCHLMIENPDGYIPQFVNAGADVITVHVEACPHLNRTIQHIKSLGVKAGVVLNPATPLVAIEEVLEYVDVVLLMSVNPGFGGQSFIPSLYRRAEILRGQIERAGLDCLVEADGGIKLENIRSVFDAGVDVVVSGSGVFGTSDPASTIREMIKMCNSNQIVEV